MLIKLNSKLLNAYALIKSNAHLLDRHLLDAAKRGSSISITLPDDELPAIRSKYEKLYANKYFKNRNKDEFKSKLIDYFDEIGIDYAKMVNKVNRLDHPSIKAIRWVWASSCSCSWKENTRLLDRTAIDLTLSNSLSNPHSPPHSPPPHQLLCKQLQQ